MVMQENNLDNKPNFIYNLDETGIQPEHRPSNIIGNPNFKPQAITSPKSSNTTVIGCVNPFLYNHGFSRVYLIRTITAFNVSTLSVQSRLFTYLPYSNNHGFSRVPFSTLKNRLFRRCLKSMIYEIIRVKCYLYFGVSKPICLFFGKGSYFKLKKVGVWKYTCVSAEIKL